MIAVKKKDRDNGDWREMYCVENHGMLSKGKKYWVRKMNFHEYQVKVRGKIIYASLDIFQDEKPITYYTDEEEDDYDYFS